MFQQSLLADIFCILVNEIFSLTMLPMASWDQMRRYYSMAMLEHHMVSSMSRFGKLIEKK